MVDEDSKHTTDGEPELAPAPEKGERVVGSTLLYSALAACCLALTVLAFVTLGGGGSYIFVLFGGILSVVLASFAYESRHLGDPVEPSP